MTDDTKTDERDFSTPDTHVCEVARFDNNGHLADVPLETSAAEQDAATDHPDAEQAE